MATGAKGHKKGCQCPLCKNIRAKAKRDAAARKGKARKNPSTSAKRKNPSTSTSAKRKNPSPSTSAPAGATQKACRCPRLPPSSELRLSDWIVLYTKAGASSKVQAVKVFRRKTDARKFVQDLGPGRAVVSQIHMIGG